MKDRLMEALRKTFRPEFLNRIDEIVTFQSLGPDEIQQDRGHPAARPAASASPSGRSRSS